MISEEADKVKLGSIVCENDRHIGIVVEMISYPWTALFYEIKFNRYISAITKHHLLSKDYKLICE